MSNIKAKLRGEGRRQTISHKCQKGNFIDTIKALKIWAELESLVVFPLKFASTVDTIFSMRCMCS